MNRPLAIARSHADAGVAALLVVEIGRDDEWRVHRVAGAAAESSKLVLRGRSVADMGGIAELAANVDLVVVDAAEPGRRAALRAIAGVVGPVRLLAVDDELLHRFGAHPPLPPVAPQIVPLRRRPSRRWPVAVVVLAATLVCGAVGVSAVGRAHRDGSTSVARIGAVAVAIPDGWRRTDLSGEPSPRAVFADPTSGSRVIVAVTPLRSGATAHSVAASLAERIRQRGDDAVSEFAASAEFAGRRVTVYRETPDSGAPIRWYVRVVGSVEHSRRQVSIGCQDSGGRGLAAACRRAVASVR